MGVDIVWIQVKGFFQVLDRFVRFSMSAYAILTFSPFFGPTGSL